MKRLILSLALLCACVTVKAQSPKADTVKALCRAVTKGGEPCCRVALANGYCFQHNPSAFHCAGTTKSGTPCKRVVKREGEFCFEHAKKD